MNDETPWPTSPEGRNPWDPSEPSLRHPAPRRSDDGDRPDLQSPDEAESVGQQPDDLGTDSVMPTPPNKWATGLPIAPQADSLADYDHPLTPSSPPEWHAARPGPQGPMSGPGDRDLASGAPPHGPGADGQPPSSYLGGPVDAGSLGGGTPRPGVPVTPTPAPPPSASSPPGSTLPPPPFGSPSTFGAPPPSGAPSTFGGATGSGGPQAHGAPHQPSPGQAPGWSGGPAPEGSAWSSPQGWSNTPGWGAPPPPPGQPGGGAGFGGPPPPGTPAHATRTDRAPAWVRGLAGLILFAVAGGAAYLLTQGGASYPSEFDERVAPLAAWVAEERGLEFEHAVEVNFLTAEEYTEAITGEESVEMDAEAEEELASASALLRALGLLEGEVDLAEATETLMDSGSLAFYSPETKQVYVRGTDLTPAVEVTLVHELVHVVQDQHFDLTRVGTLDAEQAEVLRALVEGDATRIEQRYVQAELSEEERDSYISESQANADDSQAVLDEHVPPVLTAVFAAPYMFGPTYVAYLEATGGNDAVDEAIRNIPIERHLYNPIDIDRTGPTQASPTIEMPEGAESIDEGDFGQITWFLLLSARLDSETALAATDDIYEDEFVAYRQDGLVCAQIRATAWDDEGLTNLTGALEQWKASAPDQQVEITPGDGSVLLLTCDPGADAGITADITVDTLIVPVARTQVYAELLGTGQDHDAASCGAELIIEIFDIDQLTSAEPEVDPEQQRELLSAMASCR